MKKNFVAVFCFLLLAGGLFCGCSKKTAVGSQVFEQASPDVKVAWDKAVTADKSNDYVAAITGYHSLMAQKASLSPQQNEVVNAASLAINQRMYAAANNGDEAAKTASAQLVQLQNAH
jgi:hypothetical protein